MSPKYRTEARNPPQNQHESFRSVTLTGNGVYLRRSSAGLCPYLIT